jgi:putative tryptophan/tyrosine transport system substrate-binding protein
MMDRRTLLRGLVLGVIGAPLIAGAQTARKIPRVGVLFGSPAASWIEALRQGLREPGYVEGQTVAIEWRSADGRYERLPDLAGELVRLPVDVLVAHPTIAVRAAKEATTTIPIVIPASADPVGAGLIASLARPGGNITGSTFISAEISGKRLELLKQVAPEATRVAVLANPANPATALQLKEVQGAARALSVALQVLEVRAPSAFDGAFSALTRNAPARFS